jgi:hypothetical protein
VPVGCDDDDSVTNFDCDGTNASIDAGVTELFDDAINQKCDAIPDDTERRRKPTTTALSTPATSTRS